MNMIQNPILRGFNPDPSIIRIENDYYIATSTFEWFPGVQIHHSRDLVNWELVTRPLNRLSQLNMIGAPDSCGVWAPCLSFHNGTYYLVYCSVRSFDGVWKDTPNYLVTTNDLFGEWSDPIYLNSSGFDGSLFHDDDGRKWYVSMIVDHRKGKFFGGILIQEYDEDQQKLVGKPKRIFEGTEYGKTEGPHIYKRNGYYYLLTAEGGTEYGHAVTIARSREITGPYEVHPENPLFTASKNPEAPLQKSGHADLINTPDGKWYAVFLVGRPLTQLGRCPLGRETAIEEIEWKEDDWPHSNSSIPRLEVPAPGEIEEGSVNQSVNRVYFSGPELNIHFQSLRIPMDESWMSLQARPGYLRLYGQESLSSLFHQSLIARRIQHFHMEASTCLEFSPENFQQMAGLVCYYNTGHWYYLHLMGDQDGQSKLLQIISCDNFYMQDLLEQSIDLSRADKVYLKTTLNRDELNFYYATKENEWNPIGPTLDGSIISDDYVREGGQRYRAAFTGAFVGLCCQDLNCRKIPADFAWFEYKEL